MKNVVLAAAAVLCVSLTDAKSIQFNLRQNSTTPTVLPSVLPQFNFWSNLQEFTWGLTLGVPGNIMQDKVKKCWGDSSAFFDAISKAQTDTQSNPNLTTDQVMQAINDVFMSFVAVAGSCYYFVDHIRYKINQLRELSAFFLGSEDLLNQGDFYSSGMNLGFAISRMIA